MKVGFVHPTHPHSEGTGATHSASRIVFELAERGHDVTVYPWTAPPGEATAAGETATAPGEVEIRPLDTGGFPHHSGLQLDDALRERVPEFDRYDVVHSYVLNSLPALGAVADETSAATVLTLNAYGAVCPKNDLRYMDREPCTSNGLAKCAACSVATSGGHDEDGPLYRSASRLGYLKLVREGERVADRIDAYHALSEHIRATYADFGFPADRIDVIPNILDERFAVPHESDFGAPYDLLYVGSLEEHKGTDRLVPTLAGLRERGIEARLTVVGDGGQRSDIERAARRADLADVVSVTGWLPNDELPALYADHDCFVYPGRWDEPFGRVFLEALAAGTPVVASDVGSVERIVGEGGRVTDGSVEGFVEALTDLLTDDPRAVSTAARTVVEQYRAERVVPQFVDLYERVVGGE